MTEAKRIRDRIIAELTAHVDDDLYEKWKHEIKIRNEEFAKHNRHLDGEMTYTDFLIDSILDDAGKKYGRDKETGEPLDYTEEQRLIFDVISHRTPCGIS